MPQDGGRALAPYGAALQELVHIFFAADRRDSPFEGLSVVEMFPDADPLEIAQAYRAVLAKARSWYAQRQLERDNVEMARAVGLVQ